MSFFISFLIINFPANYITEKYGVRVGLNIGCTICLIGIWINCLLNVGTKYLFINIESKKKKN